MSLRMVCDRCNRPRKDGESFNSIRYRYAIGDDYEDSDYDICPECAKQFGMFIDGGTVEEDHYKDSKPCDVVIHKLADGHYAIENNPDRVADAISDNPDDPCPCYTKNCIHIATCCGCKEYDEWKERQK